MNIRGLNYELTYIKEVYLKGERKKGKKTLRVKYILQYELQQEIQRL